MKPFQLFVLQDGSAAVTVNGTSSELDNKFYSTGIFHLNITDDDFTTLDIDIEWWEPGTQTWVVLFSFAQASGVGTETIVYGDIVADEFLPGRLRATWAIVGTEGTFTLGGQLR